MEAKVKVTGRERNLLQGIILSEYHDGQHPVGHAVWSWSATDGTKADSGTMASLVKKGLAKTQSYYDEGRLSRSGKSFGTMIHECWITQEGWEVAKVLKLEGTEGWEN